MFKKCTLNAGWTQDSFVISSCVIHPTSCLREGVMGEGCLGLECTFKSFCFKKMDLLFQFVLLPCSPSSKSNKWYKKIYWTIENWKETFRWGSPPKKDKFGGGETIKQGTVWGVKLVKKKCLLVTARRCLFEFSVLETPWAHFQKKRIWWTLYDSEINNIYIVVILQILMH